MPAEFNPLEKLARLWSASAESWVQAARACRLPDRPGTGDEGAPGGATAGVPPGDWAQVVTRMMEIQSRLLHHSLDHLPETARPGIDHPVIEQLRRLADLDWGRELERMADLWPEIVRRFQQADPGRMGRLFESMLAEYLDDLDELEEESFRVDVRPLAEAFQDMLAGRAQPSSRRIVERFLEVLSVKARYGAEYYADPETVAVGQSPRECLLERDGVKLFRYLPPDGSPARRGRPVLLVYSIINRPFILDLIPGHSFVRFLLDRGLDVYLVDWGHPGPGDTITLDDCIDPLLRGCVQAVRERTGVPGIALFGHCIGGNLALMATALFPGEIDRLVTLTTPATAAQGGVVALWTDRELFPIHAIIDEHGVMPAKLIRYTFLALKPYHEAIKWKRFLEKLGDEETMSLFFAVDRWANENVDVAGEVFRKFVVEVFHEDRFRRNETCIHGRRVDLRSITCPYLNLAATRDWIVPIDSARMLNELVASEDNQFVPIDGAHVSIMIDPQARPLWERIAGFLLH